MKVNSTVTRKLGTQIASAGPVSATGIMGFNCIMENEASFIHNPRTNNTGMPFGKYQGR